ncbi:MAG: DUF6802 family protein [Mycobacteriaceae bacterium]
MINHHDFTTPDVNGVHADIPDPHDPDHVYLDSGDDWIELGAPTIDTDGDGDADTLTVNTERGIAVVADIDNDGIVDHVTKFNKNGGYESWEYNDSVTKRGSWSVTDRGHLGRK